MGRGLGCCPSKDSGDFSDGTAVPISHGVCVEAVQTPWCFAFPLFFFGNELESIPSQKVAETGKGENQDQP